MTRFTTAYSAAGSLGYMSQSSGLDESFNTSLNGTATKIWGDLESRLTARYLYEQQDGDGLSANGSELATAGLRTIRTAFKKNRGSRLTVPIRR